MLKAVCYSMCFTEDWQYHYITFLGWAFVPPKVPVLHDQTLSSHDQRLPNDTGTFLDWICTLISSADHWLALSQGKGRTRENLALWPTLPPGRQSQQVLWPKFLFPGTPVFPCEKDLNLFWESTRKWHKISIVQGHPIAASLCSFTCQVTAFFIFTRPA